MNSDLSRGKVIKVGQLRLNNGHNAIIQQKPIVQKQSQHQPQQDSKAMNIKQNKQVIERGASWGTTETKILLSLWGEDLVQRQLTNSKRTRQVWETIAKVLAKHGFVRKSEQCRTRIFNMIAEYRRILKNPNQDRVRKCTYFEAIHKIFQARNKHQIREILDNDEDFNYDLNQQQSVNSHEFDESEDVDLLNSELHSELDDKEVFSYSMSPSHFNNSNSSFNPFSNNFSKLGTQSHNGINHTIVSGNKLNSINGQQKPSTAISFLNQINESSGQSLNASSNSNRTSLINQAFLIQNLQQKGGLQNGFHNSAQNSQANSLNDEHEHSLDAFSDQISTDPLKVNGHRKRSRSMDNNLQLVSPKRRLSDQNDLNEFNVDFLSNLDYSQSNLTLVLFNKLFDHLAKNNETMREWTKLEERRIEYEMINQKEQKERDDRRQQKFFDIFIKFQQQMLDFLATYDPSLVQEAKKLNLFEKMKEELSLEFNLEENSHFKLESIQKTDLNNNLTDEQKKNEEQKEFDTIEFEKQSLEDQQLINQQKVLKSKFINQESNSLSFIAHANDNLTDNLTDYKNYRTKDDPLLIKTNKQSPIDQSYQTDNLINEPRLLNSSSLLDTENSYISLLSNSQTDPLTQDIEFILEEEIVSNDYENSPNGNDFTFSNNNIQHEEIVN